MGMVRQKPLNNFFNGRILWQKEHEIVREFQRLLNNLVKVRIDVVKAVLCQELVASTSPRWAQKHAVKFLVSVAGNLELWNC